MYHVHQLSQEILLNVNIDVVDAPEAMTWTLWMQQKQSRLGRKTSYKLTESFSPVSKSVDMNDSHLLGDGALA